MPFLSKMMTIYSGANKVLSAQGVRYVPRGNAVFAHKWLKSDAMAWWPRWLQHLFMAERFKVTPDGAFVDGMHVPERSFIIQREGTKDCMVMTGEQFHQRYVRVTNENKGRVRQGA